MDSSPDSIGIDVPQSVLGNSKEEPAMQNDTRIVERQLEAMTEQLPVIVHLLTIPGIGLLTATALFALIGDIHRFPSGRHLASWLGLTPREYSSGLKRHLGRISKRGQDYLRTLLIHGARSTLLHARTQQPDHLREWAHKLS